MFIGGAGLWKEVIDIEPSSEGRTLREAIAKADEANFDLTLPAMTDSLCRTGLNDLILFHVGNAFSDAINICFGVGGATLDYDEVGDASLKVEKVVVEKLSER